MKERIYAVVGSFAMKKGTKKGVHIFRYEPETGTFASVGNFRPELNAGCVVYKKESGVLYVTNESRERPGEIGGGGQIACFRLDSETGLPEWLNEKDTCAVQPSYLCLDRLGDYALVPHHGSGNVVTKTVKKDDGTYGAFADSDDGTMALFAIREDGSLGELCDVVWHEIERENGKIKKIPHLHNCEQSPDGMLFLSCDKGLDVIHKYHLDRENGKLSFLGDTFVEEGVHPRYGKFHPTLPVFYQNCENSAFLHVWNYESKTGTLERIQKLPLLFDEEAAASWTAEGAADLAVTKDGRYLYASIRGLNVLSVFAASPDGRLALIQNLECQGSNPRGLCLAPDERFLFVMNRDSGSLARFCRGEDGKLTADGAETVCELPGNMQFVICGDGQE